MCVSHIIATGKGQGFEMSKQKTCKNEHWPRQTLVTGAALLLLFFLLPFLFLPREESPEKEPEPTATLPILTPAAAATLVPGWDQNQTLRLLCADQTVETVTLADYLWGVVAAEMPASFSTEALKAQAVAARTYCLYQRAGAGDKHPGADVCTDSTCCQAYLTREQAAAAWGENAQRYADKITAAVSDTDGLLCLYNGQPIDAVFFSSAAGKTSDAAQVWGSDVPYLSSVDSPEGEEVPGWHTVVTFSLEEFTQKFSQAYPAADFSGDSAAWFSALATDDSGAVSTVSIGGVTVTGTKVRTLFGLRSTHFTAAAGDTVTFWVTGYGHGVGMSQYGANALAAEGKTFDEILKWYYTGISVGGME